MHYTVLVIIPPDTNLADQGAVTAAVATVLAPFDEQRDVPAWKDYQGAESIAGMRACYPVPPDDLAALVPHLDDWCGDGHGGGVDEHGLFAWSTRNPLGMYDYYTIGGRWDGAIRDEWGVTPANSAGNACRLRDLPRFDTRDAATQPEPGGSYHRGSHDVALAERTPTWLTREQWDSRTQSFPANPRYADQVADLCARYPDHIGVLVDYHR